MDHARIADFWTWFKPNVPSLQGGPSLADEVTRRLRAVDPALCWEIGRSGSGSWDFAIRAEDPAKRSHAFLVVESAPSLPGWTITPFRRPEAMDTVLEWRDGTKWSFADFTASLSPVSDGPFLSLVLSHPDFRHLAERSRAGPGFTVLDAALGEELMHDAIDGVRFVADAPQEIALLQLRPRVRAAVADLRSRAPRGNSDAWLSGKAGNATRPLSFVLADALDLRQVGRYPWLLELKVQLMSPDRRGLPGIEELKRLQDVEEPLESALRAERPTVFWGTCTGDGRRDYFFYTPGPVRGLRERTEAAMKSLGLSGTVELRHDARWAVWRSLVRR